MGGEPRLIAADGLLPAVSPDGKNIAYLRAAAPPELFIVPAAGGEPRSVSPGFVVLGIRPIWSPDGRQIVFFGNKTGRTETQEWWFASASGGPPLETNWSRWAAENKYLGSASVWLPNNNAIAWLARDGNTQIYWLHSPQMSKLGADLQMVPLTFGGSLNFYPAVAAGKMAYQSGTQQGQIWSLPADTNQGRVTGPIEKLTNEQANYRFVSATPDGMTLTFSADRAGSHDVFIRDMASGQDRALVADAPELSKLFTHINAAGTDVVYATYDATGVYDVYAVPAQGGARRKVCGSCGPAYSLSPDGKYFLTWRQDDSQSKILVVDVASGKSVAVLDSSRAFYPRFSPDGNWISFLVRSRPGFGEVAVAPFRGPRPVPGQDWITVTPAPANISQAFWSPNGGLIYYVQSAANAYTLMARRLDASHRPTGAPFRVFQFNGRVHPTTGSDALTAVPGRIIGGIPETTSNIWMMDLPK